MVEVRGWRQELRVRELTSTLVLSLSLVPQVGHYLDAHVVLVRQWFASASASHSFSLHHPLYE